MRPAFRSFASLLAVAMIASWLGTPGSLTAQGGLPGRGAVDPPPPRALIFFPPFPPALDAPRPRLAPGAIHPSAPGELSEHVGEIFYPPLSARLQSNTLTDRHRQQLTSYRAAKVGLQQEIRLELAARRDADPAARHHALQALAQRQAPRLAELGRTAERLRSELITGGAHWNAHRDWRLSERTNRGFSPLEIAEVMLGYAFYEDGLLPTQRRLLREIAHELEHAALNPQAAAASQPHVFFSPSPARILWPADAPAEATARWSVYQTKKAVLKKELYEAVSRHDIHSLRFFAKPLTEIAPKQAARLTELEKLAEEIRVALGPLARAPAALPRSPLPPSLAEQAAALSERRSQLQRETTLRMEAMAARALEENLLVRITFRFEPDGLKFMVIPRVPGRGLSARVQAMGTAISAIADDYGRELAAIANDEETLRTEIGAALGSRTPQAIDKAFDAAVLSVEAGRYAGPHADYRTAVFEPGLSPEQRIVLFDGAIEQLDLPLPRGELQPWRRAESW